MKRIAVLTLFIAVSLVLGPPLGAQQAPFVTGLRAPMEMAFTHQGNLIVSESGNGPNTGRVSLVDRTTGTRRTLIEGLPSGIHVVGPGNSSPSGPAGLALQGSTLYVSISNGDAVMAGPVPASEQPSPNPSSPILSSVVAIQTSKPLDEISGGFVLEPSEHARLKSGETVTRTNSAGETLTIRLVVDFPNYTSEPRPDFPGNVRAANSYGVAAVGQTLYVVDASQNVIYRVDANSGAYTTLTTFAKVQNPTPVGPPMIDAVPNSVRLRGNELLVTTLTGFPFPAGKAEIRRVDITTGANEPFLGGLTSALDVAPLSGGPQSEVLVVEFSTNQMQGAPGRLILTAPGAAQTVVASGLITPTGVLVDRRNGDIFVTQLGPGTVVRINAAALIPIQHAGAVIPVAGSTNGAFGSFFKTSAQITNPNPFAISGRFIFHAQEGGRDGELAYVLSPFATLAYPDLTASAGASGIGSLDIVPAVGPAPVSVVRVVNEASSCKPSLQIPQVDRESALAPGDTATLITHADAGQRFNVGIRALEHGATLSLTLYDTNGTLLGSAIRNVGANEFVQFVPSDLLGVTVRANQSIAVAVTAGSAIVYGSAVNNDGTGMTLQLAR